VVSNLRIIDAVSGVRMETDYGDFQAAAIRLRGANGRESEHVCLYRGMSVESSCLLRLNSACITSELFGCRRCDCSWQFRETLRLFARERSCALIYTQTDEGRGHGVISKLRTYLESDGSPSSGLRRRYHETRDERDFNAQAFVAHWLGVRRARLLSSNREKQSALARAGVEVTELVPLRSPEERFAELYRCQDELDGRLSRNARSI
jgi:GTP cyclohydrolase II